MSDLFYVHVRGNRRGERVGVVKLNEKGYYKTNYDNEHNSDEDVAALVEYLNNRLGVPKDVADSAFAGSMFGWHCPAAQPAVEWAKEQEVKK